MRKHLPVILIILLLSGCGAPELIPIESPGLPTLEITVTLPTPEEVKIEDPDPLPITLEPVPLPTNESIQMTLPAIPSGPQESLDSLIDQAKRDLAKRLSIPVDQISLVEAQEVVWRDSSLGCPQKGMMYLQVLMPGYLVILETNGKEYEYHAGMGTDAFYCENPTSPAPGSREGP